MLNIYSQQDWGRVKERGEREGGERGGRERDEKREGGGGDLFYDLTLTMISLPSSPMTMTAVITLIPCCCRTAWRCTADILSTAQLGHIVTTKPINPSTMICTCVMGVVGLEALLAGYGHCHCT